MKEAVNLIKRFEGFQKQSYLCPGNVWTIGYGTTRYQSGEKVKKGDTISPYKADLEIWAEADKIATSIKEIGLVLNQNQLNALISFVYNVGIGNFKKSTMLKKLKAKDYAGAALEFPKWNKSNGKVLKGLITRREAEQELFTTEP